MAIKPLILLHSNCAELTFRRDFVNKSKYDEFVKPRLFEIAAWARDGIPEKDMAKKLSVPYSSFRAYKKVIPQLAKILKENKEIYDIKLENALFKRALGYSFTEETREASTDPKTGETKLAVTKKVTKDIPPDVGALKFSLINRMPEKYKDKQAVQHDGEISIIKKLEDFIIDH